MKKIISIFLVLIVILSVHSVSLAEIPSKADNGISLENIMELLKITGIIGEEYSPSEESMTRGEFAAYLVRSAGIGEYFGSYNTNPFPDVNAENPRADEIAAAKDMKFISGYSDGYFRPENTVSVLEALICFVRVLGYGVKAEGLGGYPAGYYSIINELKLANGISGNYSEPLSKRNAVILINNALHTKIMFPDSVGDKTSYKVADGITLLYNSFGIEYIEGIVKGVDITNLFGENDLPYYSIYIGERVFYTGMYNVNHLLGYYVRAYFENNEVEDVVKLAYALEGKNDVKIFRISDISNISDGKIRTADENGKEKSNSYDKNASIIYNGTNTGEKLSLNLIQNKNGEFLSGTVKLLDNNKDGAADVVFIEGYEDFVVGGVDVDTGEVFDYNDSTLRYNLNVEGDDPYVFIYDEEGKELVPASLSVGMSLAIFDSRDDAYQKYTRAYASKRKITGKIESFEQRDKYTCVTINGEEYVFSEYARKNSRVLVPGRTVEVLLNCYGDITRIDYSVGQEYKFVMICAAGKVPGFEGGFNIKIMDEDANITVIPAAEKLCLDGNEYSTENQRDIDIILNRLKAAATELSPKKIPPEGNYYFQMVKYGINSEGRINYIDTILDKDGTVMDSNNLDHGNEVFYGRNDGKNIYYQLAHRTLGLSIIVRENSKMFFYPPSGKEYDEMYYAVRTNPFTASGEQDTNILYFRDSNEGYATSVLMKEFVRAEIGRDISAMVSYVVTKVTDVIDSQGQPAKKWYLFNKGIREEVVATSNLESSNSEASEITKAEDVKTGDIIYFIKDELKDEVDAFLMLYSGARDYSYNIGETNNKMIKAEVVDSTEEGILLEYQETDSAGNANYFNVVFNNIINTNNITVINLDTNMVRSGSTADLIGRKNDPANYTRRVVVRQYNSNIRAIRELYIYK